MTVPIKTAWHAVLVLSALPLFPLQGQQVRNVSRVGTTAASFLEVGVGARALALGEAYAAVANDLTASYWNPAGLALIERAGATFFRSPWLVDIDYTFAAGALPLGRAGWLGIFAGGISMPDMPVRTIENPEGTGEQFGATSVVLGLSYARALADRFRFGGSIKYVREQIWHMSAGAVAYDVGTLFTTRNRGINIGMSISNFGPKMRLEGRDTQVKVDVDQEKAGNNDRIDANLDTWKWPLPLLFGVGLSG
ncbi:MAG: PorV/PorQ family protein, partial [Candidatus Neomarinimicrobiota bacterium]